MNSKFNYTVNPNYKLYHSDGFQHFVLDARTGQHYSVSPAGKVAVTKAQFSKMYKTLQGVGYLDSEYNVWSIDETGESFMYPFSYGHADHDEFRAWWTERISETQAYQVEDEESIAQEYAQLIAKVELGTTTWIDNNRRIQMEKEYGLSKRSSFVQLTPHSKAPIASVIRAIETEMRVEATQIKAALQRKAQQTMPEFWLIETETSPTLIQFKIVSTLPRFRWSGSSTFSLSNKTDAQIEKEYIEARRWAEGIFAHAQADPYADRFYESYI